MYLCSNVRSKSYWRAVALATILMIIGLITTIMAITKGTSGENQADKNSLLRLTMIKSNNNNGTQYEALDWMARNSIEKNQSNPINENNSTANQYEAEKNFSENQKDSQEPDLEMILQRRKRNPKNKYKSDFYEEEWDDDDNEYNDRVLPKKKVIKFKRNKKEHQLNENLNRKNLYRKLPSSYHRINKKETIKSKGNLYSKGESRNVEKYDFLGSGNFEIIRGGILDKQHHGNNGNYRKFYNQNNDSNNKMSHSRSRNLNNNRKQTIRPMITNNNNNNNHENENDDHEETDEEHDPSKENENNSNDNEDNSEDDPDTFEPFNFDLFGSDPILQSFHGYDNFAASQIKPKIVK